MLFHCEKWKGLEPGMVQPQQAGCCTIHTGVASHFYTQFVQNVPHYTTELRKMKFQSKIYCYYIHGQQCCNNKYFPNKRLGVD